MTLPDPKRLTTSALLFELIDNRDVVRLNAMLRTEEHMYRSQEVKVPLARDQFLARYWAVAREFDARVRLPSDE